MPGTVIHLIHASPQIPHAGGAFPHSAPHAEPMAQRPPRWPGSLLRAAMSPSPARGENRQAGQALPLVAVFIIVLMAIAGAVIDIGNAYRVHQQLQASADAAAAAGADNLPDTGAALAPRAAYSSRDDGKNPIVGAGNVTISAIADCSTSRKFCNPANTVHVTESTRRADHVPARDRDRHASPRPCTPRRARRAARMPLDIMIVLDRTGSMSGSKLDSRQAGHHGVHEARWIRPSTTSAWRCCRRPRPPPPPATRPVVDALRRAQRRLPAGAALERRLRHQPPATSTRAATLISTINCVQAGGQTAYANALDAAQDESRGRPPRHPEGDHHPLGRRREQRPRLPRADRPYRTNPCQTAVNSAARRKAQGC